MTTDEGALQARVNDERRRELAIEHLLFGTIRFVANRHPELLDELEGSVAHLGDSGHGDDKDDDAVRDVARRFLVSLRRA